MTNTGGLRAKVQAEKEKHLIAAGWVKKGKNFGTNKGFICGGDYAKAHGLPLDEAYELQENLDSIWA